MTAALSRLRACRVPGETADARQALEQLRPVCPVCKRRFDAVRPGQRFDRPGCRAVAHEREQVERYSAPDLFSRTR
jgi:hypothetical protein